MQSQADIYTLNSGDLDEEITRLNTQHVLFDDVMNNELLPPHITAELSSNPSPKICEIATGTGIWLSAIAKTLPASAELVGLDFDTTKFPPKSQLPVNVELKFNDMYEAQPEELQEKFDVVHLRFIAMASRKGQGIALVKNLLTLVKPGGWFIWGELTENIPHVQPPIDAWSRYLQLAHKFGLQQGRDVELPQALPHYLKSAGCVDVDYKVYYAMSLLYGPKGADIIKRSQNELLMAVNILVDGILAKGGVDGLRTKAEGIDIITQTKRDLRGDVKVNTNIFRCYGRKPL
ncbi:hypothetical protein RRF57_005154 [Xylaria bambusicola]|uniref:Methyltransferase domain-containing protein n=1 Tax=Xylaria bambusicola TaxID=326684 RepID=A0AAN7UKY3_9PEZI